MPSEIPQDPLESHMTASEFRHVVMDMIDDNPDGDPTARPFIYSIRVVRPVDFSHPPAKFPNKEIQASSIPKGSLYHPLLYRLDHDDVRDILVQFVSADKVEVKYAWFGDDRRKTERVTLSA